MEHLEFTFPATPAGPHTGPTVCGVVGSGNLEILIRPAEPLETCAVSIQTSARGFGEIWRAVLADFAAHHAVGGTHIVIHDMGATPAVVSLRLGQTLAEYRGDAQ